jgi:hypothetical protein
MAPRAESQACMDVRRGALTIVPSMPVEGRMRGHSGLASCCWKCCKRDGTGRAWKGKVQWREIARLIMPEDSAGATPSPTLLQPVPSKQFEIHRLLMNCESWPREELVEGIRLLGQMVVQEHSAKVWAIKQAIKGAPS